MGFNNFPYQFPPASQQFVNPQNGQPTLNLWRFLQALFNRTGQSNGTTYQVATGLTAAGTAQATALALGADWNQVTSAPNPSGSPTGPFSGVVLPSMQPGSDITVWNADTGVHDTLNVYPFAGAEIGSGAANAAYPIAPGFLVYFQCWSSTLIVPIIKVNPLTL